MQTYVLAFESTHAAMATEKALMAIGPTMLPTPKDISAGCGMSLKYQAEGPEEALEIARRSPDARGLAALYVQAEGTYTLVQRI